MPENPGGWQWENDGDWKKEGDFRELPLPGIESCLGIAFA